MKRGANLSKSPILKDFPHSFETERLIIRAPLPGDGSEICEAMMETLDILQLWMPWAQQNPTEDAVEASVRKAHCEFLERTDFRFHLYEKDTKIFVGSSGLHQVNWQIPKFEIGYWCRKSFMGKGYITESVRGLTVFAFQVFHANRIEICCEERNMKSRKVAERLNYQLEGVLRDASMDMQGNLTNKCIYSMIADDFRKLSLRKSD